MKYTTWLIACLLLTPGLFSGRQGIYQPQEIDQAYSFEDDLEGWTIRSDQSESGLPPPVTRSQERAADGLTSLKFTINRQSVFQRVWIEKVFNVRANQIYDVSIDYSFASRDCCHSN